MTKDQLEARLQQLQSDYALSQMGLLTGWHIMSSILAFLLCLFACACIVFLSRGNSFLSGYQYVAIVVTMLFALTIYFAFVFARRARLRLEIGRTKKLMEMCAEESVR